MRLLVFPPVFGIIVLLLLESFVVKSILFDKNDPILIHYLISGLLITALTFLVFSRQSSRAYLRQLPGMSIAIFAFLWLIVATSTRSNSLEWASLYLFARLVLCSTSVSRVNAKRRHSSLPTQNCILFSVSNFWSRPLRSDKSELREWTFLG